MKPAKKILVIQLRQLGDILLTTPVIRAIKAAHPQAEISFLTHPMGQLILSGNPDLSEHLIYPTESRWQQLKFLLTLRSKGFGVVFDFMGNPRSALLTWISGAAQRFSFASPRSWAYTGVVSRESGHDYIVLEKFRILSQAGIQSDDVRLVLPWNENHLLAWHNFEAAISLQQNQRPRIALSPTHRRENRRWPDSSWIELANHLAKSLNASVIWLWGPGEEDEVRTLQNLCREATFMAPKTTFRELAGLIAQCDLFIGNSNGPSHVAVAVNTPSVQLHGPTDAPSWSPMTARHRVIAKERMNAIPVADVSALVQEMESVIRTEASHHGLIKNSDDVWRVRPQL